MIIVPDYMQHGQMNDKDQLKKENSGYEQEKSEFINAIWEKVPQCLRKPLIILVVFLVAMGVIGGAISLIKTIGESTFKSYQDISSPFFSATQETNKEAYGGWGDNINGRKAYTERTINEGILGDQITFNSISNGLIGHEFNCVGAKEKGKTGIWNANRIDAKDARTYTVRLYVHNDNPLGYYAVAEDVKALFELPKGYAKEQIVTGYLDSSNAIPSKCWDSVVFISENPILLEYVKGSARLYNTEMNKAEGIALPDEEIFTKGTRIGYSALDGMIPGGYDFACVVTIDIMVHQVY